MTTLAAAAHFTPLRGFSITCHAPNCRQETAEQAPSRYVRTPELAVHTAQLLGWIHAQPHRDQPHAWFCPMHQAYDATGRRWIPTGVRA